MEEWSECVRKCKTGKVDAVFPSFHYKATVLLPTALELCICTFWVWWDFFKNMYLYDCIQNKNTYTCTHLYMYMLFMCLHKNKIQWTAWSLLCNCLHFGRNCYDIIIQSQQNWVWLFSVIQACLNLTGTAGNRHSPWREIRPFLPSASKSCDLRKGH